LGVKHFLQQEFLQVDTSKLLFIFVVVAFAGFRAALSGLRNGKRSSIWFFLATVKSKD